MALRREPETLGAVAQRIARQPEPGRRAREVPSGRLEDVQEHAPLALGLGGGRRAHRHDALGVGAGRRRQSQRGRRQRRLVREQGRPLQHVRQLTHVAGPGVREQRRSRVLGEHAGGEAVVLAHAAQELLGQQQDVTAPCPQRRQQERDDGQPVIEIRAEAPLPGGGGQVLAGGRDDRDVQRLAPRAAEPAHRALLDDLQQLGLQGQR
jgi:hypothetical protein